MLLGGALFAVEVTLRLESGLALAFFHLLSFSIREGAVCGWQAVP
jgi:hypothetical protein